MLPRPCSQRHAPAPPRSPLGGDSFSSAAQSRKLDLNPCGTAAIRCFWSVRCSRLLSSCFPCSLRNTQGLRPLASLLAASTISIARPHNGTRWSARTSSYDHLLDGKIAQMVFTDPPYNVPIDGHVCGRGRARHGEFAMAAGEMSEAEFTAFLKTVLRQLALHSRDGALHFVCMDWRHLFELLTVTTEREEGFEGDLALSVENLPSGI